MQLESISLKKEDCSSTYQSSRPNLFIRYKHKLFIYKISSHEQLAFLKSGYISLSYFLPTYKCTQLMHQQTNARR